MSTQHSSARERPYTSVISNWDAKSAVRTKPRRLLLEEDCNGFFFSAHLTPETSHPLVLSRGQDYASQLLTHRLYSYLEFTTILEQEIVNPVVLRLSRDDFGLTLPDAMRFDAYRIYCDEAYHALFSADIKMQVQNTTRIPHIRSTDPMFARAIRLAREALPSNVRTLIEFCATVVSETLISGSLTQIPQDQDVVSFVREAIADHAADERTHHAYFTKAFEIAWPQIDSTTQCLIAPYFADFILGFLAPDSDGQRDALWRMGFTREESAQIVWESHPMDKTLSDVRHAARSTLRLLTRMGVLDHGNAEQRFHDLGILPAGSFHRI